MEIWGDPVNPCCFGLEEDGFQECGAILLGERIVGIRFLCVMTWWCHNYLRAVTCSKFHGTIRLLGRSIVKSLEGKWDS
jgi:hypothetical protein